MQHKKILPFIAGSLLLSAGVTIAKPNSHDFFNKFDHNSDGNISLTEFNSNLNDSFSRIDKDGSGSFEMSEFKQHNEQRKAEYKQKKKARHTEKKQQKFKGLDVNADGILTRNEFVNAAVTKAQAKATEKFLKLDGNNADGKVTEQEFMLKKCDSKAKKRGKKGHHAGQSHHADKMFSKMDANKNGSITPKEYKQSRLSWFNKLDADKNGLVSHDELKQAHTDRRKK